MKRIAIISLAGMALLAAGPSRRTFTGVVSDSMCGAGHTMMKIKPDAKCVRECVRAGSQYALLQGKNVYTMSEAKAADKYAGQTVAVTGTLNEKTGTIQVESIGPAQ